MLAQVHCTMEICGLFQVLLVKANMVTNYTNRPSLQSPINMRNVLPSTTITSFLQTCNKTPSQVESEQDVARTLHQQEEDLQKLRVQVSVLAHAKDTDGRRFRQIAVERQREREDLKREVDRLKVRLAFC